MIIMPITSVPKIKKKRDRENISVGSVEMSTAEGQNVYYSGGQT